MYIAMAQRGGIDIAKLGGTLQNDILKEFHSQNEFICTPEAGETRGGHHRVRNQHLPKWNSVSISGYHIREAGSSATQELAFTLRDGMEYVEAAMQRGLDVDTFASTVVLLQQPQRVLRGDRFEPLAASGPRPCRAAAKSDRSLLMRTHVQTAGCSLTEQQPLNNIVRVAYQAMAGVLGGCQSLHTDSMDETLGLPTETAVRVRWHAADPRPRTGVHRAVDPLGGSWYVEALTDQMQQDGDAIIKETTTWVAWSKASTRATSAVRSPKPVAASVGRWKPATATSASTPSPKATRTSRSRSCRFPTTTRRTSVIGSMRSSSAHDDAVKASLEAIRTAARADENVMDSLVAGAHANCTLGEMVQAMADVYGRYTGGPEW